MWASLCFLEMQFSVLLGKNSCAAVSLENKVKIPPRDLNPQNCGNFKEAIFCLAMRPTQCDVTLQSYRTTSRKRPIALVSSSTSGGHAYIFCCGKARQVRIKHYIHGM